MACNAVRPCVKSIVGAGINVTALPARIGSVDSGDDGVPC